MSAKPRVLCESTALVEGGKAMRFELVDPLFPTPGFVVRFAGHSHAWVNRCPHKGTELDWMAGEVFDESGLYLICATHGAMFDPETGLCVSGPCRGEFLTRIAVEEKDGVVYLPTAGDPDTEAPS